MSATANGAAAEPLKFLIYSRTGRTSRPTFKPTHVFNAAGVTGRPNVDWCESHRVETIRTNVVGKLTCAGRRDWC
ncbi:hypothetical protein ABFS82_05G097200 [Erythranthe guttata]